MTHSAKISILGLYTYDPNLFDQLVVPAAIDKEDLINEIVFSLAELEVLYADADMMTNAIGIWSRNRLQAWDRLAIVMYEQYDPFINIKRDETRTITQENVNQTRRNERTDSAASYTDTTLQQVNAWDTTSMTNRDRSTSDGNTSQTDSQDGLEQSEGTVTTTEHFHVEGDSAITDAQDVARKEFELRSRYNLIKYIVNEFKQRFCLQIY